MDKCIFKNHPVIPGEQARRQLLGTNALRKPGWRAARMIRKRMPIRKNKVKSPVRSLLPNDGQHQKGEVRSAGGGICLRIRSRTYLAAFRRAGTDQRDSIYRSRLYSGLIVRVVSTPQKPCEDGFINPGSQCQEVTVPSHISGVNSFTVFASHKNNFVGSKRQ